MDSRLAPELRQFLALLPFPEPPTITITQIRNVKRIGIRGLSPAAALLHGVCLTFRTAR